MRKAFSLAFFIIGLMALASIIMMNIRSERADIPAIFDKSISSPQEIPPAPPLEKSPNQGNAKGLAKKFLDNQLALDERLDIWMEIQKTPSDSDSTLEHLLSIATSANPYEGRHLKEHSVEEREYQREEGFRIMALQSIEKSIHENRSSIQVLQNVAEQAASPTIRSIARKMYEFALRGQSYTDLFEKAVSAEDIPKSEQD